MSTGACNDLFNRSFRIMKLQYLFTYRFFAVFNERRGDLSGIVRIQFHIFAASVLNKNNSFTVNNDLMSCCKMMNHERTFNTDM